MVRLFQFVLVATAALIAFPSPGEAETTASIVSSPSPPISLPARQHPFLFADKETFAAAKERARRHPWAQAQLDSITSQAETILASPLEVPGEGGQWSHYYICRKCATNLREANGKHVCAKCRTEHTGWPFDQVAAGLVHNRNWRAVETLGLAWQFTGDERYAARAREILLAYADRYSSYPYHDYKGGTMKRGARVFAQTLDESVHAIHVAWGYDLVHGSPAMTDADRRAIENGFLRGIVQTIRRNDMGISNWQTWHNAALAAIGFCIEDAEIAGEALDGPSGLRFQLRASVLPDGFWYEGAASYHYYALDALRWTTEAAHAAGIDFYQNADYKRLYDAPVGYTFPDLTFPAVNDSFVASIGARRPMYEIAYSRFRDARYLPILSMAERDSLEALLWGADELPADTGFNQTSHNFAGLGAAVLRQGSGEDALYVHLDYGPHGGAHGHQDKLAVIFFAHGKQLAPDPGTVKYSSPLHAQWYSTTVAHNALCVDGKNQKDAEGRLTLFHSEPGFSVARAECDTAYPGVRMERTLVLTDSYLLDVVQADSDSTHTYDWLWHNEGKPVPSLKTKPRKKQLRSSNGYQHMTDIREGRTSETWSADFQTRSGGLHLAMLGGARTGVYFGNGMTDRPPRPLPMVVARRTGNSATFVSVMEPYRKQNGARTEPRGIRMVPDETGSGFDLIVDSASGSRDTFRMEQRGSGTSDGTPRPVRFIRANGSAPAKTFEAK